MVTVPSRQAGNTGSQSLSRQLHTVAWMPEAWRKGLTQRVGLVILSGIPNPILIDEAYREGQIFTLFLIVYSTLLSN